MSICTNLDLYFEMGPQMSENHVKESQSRVAPPIIRFSGGVKLRENPNFLKRGKMVISVKI